MIILLIGPHRAGKTTSGNMIAKSQPDVNFVDLDVFIEQKWKTPLMAIWRSHGSAWFAKLCQQEIERLAASITSGLTLVAVGAGVFFDDAGDISWLHNYRCIALTGSPESIHPRTVGFSSIDDYRRKQFSPYLISIYNGADIVIDTGANEENETFTRILNYLRQIKHTGSDNTQKEF